MAAQGQEGDLVSGRLLPHREGEARVQGLEP